MQDPHVAFELFGRPIYWYGVFFAGGFLAAMAHLHHWARRTGRPTGTAGDVLLWIMVGSVLGARGLYVLANWAEFAERPLRILNIREGGLVFYGGLIGAVAATVLFARSRREAVWAFGDLVITAAPLGHAFGRIGCFLNDCCFGNACAQPWAVEVDGAQVHPVQLYEAAGNLAIYAVLWQWFARRPPAGRVVALYLLLYPPLRFFNEMFRGDPRQELFGLHHAQWMSVGLFLAGLVLWRLRRRAPRATFVA